MTEAGLLLTWLVAFVDWKASSSGLLHWPIRTLIPRCTRSWHNSLSHGVVDTNLSLLRLCGFSSMQDTTRKKLSSIASEFLAEDQWGALCRPSWVEKLPSHLVDGIPSDAVFSYPPEDYPANPNKPLLAVCGSSEAASGIGGGSFNGTSTTLRCPELKHARCY